MLEYIKADYFGGGWRVRAKARKKYTARNYAMFCGGQLIETKYCDETQEFTTTLGPGQSVATGSIYIEDIGGWTQFENADIPYISMQARANDGLTSQRLGFEWDVIGKYKLSEIYGDTQITGLTITGARKNVNVELVKGCNDRGRLYIEIRNVGATNIIRFYSGDYLVAEGSTETTSFTCTEYANSGLTISGTLNYTADVDKKDAWLDVLWPAAYYLYWSTSPLSFPSEPNFIFEDTGAEEYAFQTGNLAVGDYYWNILSVDAEGQVETSPTVPADQKAVRYVPAKPTITDVTYSPTAGGLTVTFTNGEAGCTYKGYYNYKGRAINYGDQTDGPTPIGPTATNATSLFIPTPPDTTADDYTAEATTIAAAFDEFVTQLNASFTLDQNQYAYLTTLEAQYAILTAAIDAYGSALDFTLQEKKEALLLEYNRLYDQVEAYLDWGFEINVDGNENFSTVGFNTGEEWNTQIGVLHGNLLNFLGGLLDNNPKRYALPNGALPGSNQGAETLGTTEDGFNDTGATQGVSILDLARPYVRNCITRIVVRATKSGNEEQNGDFYEVEWDGGDLVGKRPNVCALKSLSAEYVDDVAVEFVSTSSSSFTNVSASTVGAAWTHIVNAGENDHAVLVIAVYVNGTVLTPSFDIFVNGVEVDAPGTYVTDGYDFVYLKYLENPDVGANNIQVTFWSPTTVTMQGMSVLVENCREGNPISFSDGDAATNTNIVDAVEPTYEYDSDDYYARGGVVGVYLTKDGNSHSETLDAPANVFFSAGENAGGLYLRYGAFYYNPPQGIGSTLNLESSEASTNYLGLAMFGLNPVIAFDISVTGQYVTSDQEVAPAYFDLYIVPEADTIDLTDPDASIAAPASIRNYMEFTFADVRIGAPGWYKIAVVARSADGVRNEIYEEELRYFSEVVPEGLNKKAYSIRNRGR